MNREELEIPKNLKHKPIVFEKVFGDTDAKFFSIGKPQWDNADKNFSIKVFRYVNNRWSPQSEEIPLERFLKMAEFLIECIDGNFCEKEKQRGSSFEKLQEKLSKMKSDNVFKNIYKVLRKWQEENR